MSTATLTRPSTTGRPTLSTTHAAAWNLNISAVTIFVAQHGRAPKQRETATVPIHGDVAVGRWLHKQFDRTLHPVLLAELLDALDGHPVTRDQHWMHNLAALKTYIDTYGELPAHTQTVDGNKLGQWVADRRKEYIAGTLGDDRIDLLENIRGWTWSHHQEHFDLGLAKFIEYKAEHKSGWVPVRYVTADGFPLGAWCRWRRRTDVPHPVEETLALNEAGFSWDIPPADDRPSVAAEAVAEPSRRSRRTVARFASDSGWELPGSLTA